MARFLRKIDRKAGQPPGAVIFVGERKMERPMLRVIRFDPQTVQEEEPESVEDVQAAASRGGVLWANLDGLHDESILHRFGAGFGLPSLVLEDVANTSQRPKAEDFEEFSFICARMLWLGEDRQVHAEQLSMAVFSSVLLTFQERTGDVFDAVRQRIRSGRGRVRRRDAPYLACALLDSVMENCIRVIEVLGERIEDMGDEVLNDPSPELLEEIHEYRREVAYVRKHLRPMREMVHRLARSESELFGPDMRPFLDELTDLADQASEAADLYRDMLGDHLNAYNMVMANRLNDVMRFLTVFATIFIPLTFVAGVYGMNFQHMPELGLRWAYPAFWGLIVALGGGMIVYFRKKGWL
jgi:magnesium transporter